MRKKLIETLALLLIVLLFSSGCVLKASNTDTTVTQNIEVVQTTKEPTETAVVTTPTQKADVTSATTVKETTAATTPAAETTAPAATTKTTTAPAATTKSTTAPAATTKAPAATTKATTAATTAAPPVETAPPQTAAPAYAENCDNIKSQIIAQLQAKGLWYPDAEEAGGGSIQLSVGYGNSDEQYATAFVNAKFGQSTTIGATSVSVWIESGYLNMSYTKCTLPAA